MQGITPIGKQQEVMALPASGHIVVLGTAGSGKTTIALLRAQHLANVPNHGNVLLVTFNGALVKYMRGIGNFNLNNLVVENYHKFARGYLNYRGKMETHCILDTDLKPKYIEKAIIAVKSLHPEESTLRRSLEFFVDEITFIQQFGYTNAGDYYSASRVGRSSANVKRENRPLIFEVYEKYIQLRKESGYLYDWDDIALYTYQELCEDKSQRRYSHIIVDEGQDFSPMMIKSLVQAVNPNGSFSFFGDVAQQIYGSRLSWRDSGIETNRIWRFDVNYRNPATISNFAKDIMKSKYWQKSGDIIEATTCVAEGPKPALIHFADVSCEIDWVISNSIELSKKFSTVIICRSRADIRAINKQLIARNVYAIVINKDTPGYSHVKTLYLSTFHAAKGLEFDNVIVPFLDADTFPDPDSINNAVSIESAYADELKLLYVAATRSKYGLYMTFSGDLSPLFPESSQNYNSFEVSDL